MSEAEEIAKAIQESAKLGTKGLEVAEKAGGFFAKVFREPAEEVSGMITDKLRFVRWKRLVNMADEVDAILSQRGINETRAVPPKLALPILEQATLEDDPDLQSLWNHLLANAMDPSFNDEIRYGFIDMIKNITGTEARMLNMFYISLLMTNRLKPSDQVYNWQFEKEQHVALLGVTEEEYAVAANNLIRMQLLATAFLKKGVDAVTLTPLGVKFIEACIK
jgi:hypothetical protein